jgi:uncharacterized protein (TIGR00369 family)
MAAKKSAHARGSLTEKYDLADHPIAKLLGIRLLSADPERIRAEMDITPQHMNRSGRVAGGIIMAFADVIGARGTVVNLPPGCRTTTVESKTNFFSAGIGPVLRADSVPLHIGRTTMVWQTTVSDDNGKRLAIVTQTQIVIAPAAKATPAAGDSEAVRTPATPHGTKVAQRASRGRSRA